MRKLRAATLFPFLLSLMSFVSLLSFSFSCTSPKSSHDTDALAPDGDIPVADDAVVVDDATDDAIFVE
ncbi:MAG TPA: hypothetical protein P5077_13670, partial [bacterium]|nr:hypothetical protein [bacterium]